MILWFAFMQLPIWWERGRARLQQRSCRSLGPGNQTRSQLRRPRDVKGGTLLLSLPSEVSFV